MQDQYTEHCSMVFARIFYYITVVFGTPKSAVGRLPFELAKAKKRANCVEQSGERNIEQRDKLKSFSFLFFFLPTTRSHLFRMF